MDREHWLFLAGVAGAVAALACIALWIRPGGRGAKAAARLCLSALLLLLSGAAGGVGIGGINALTVACLGLPGYLLLSALRLL